MTDVINDVTSVIDVLEGLHPRFSAITTVVNWTGEVLTLVSTSQDSGSFATLPAERLLPGATDNFGTISTGLMRGIDCTAVYDVGGKSQWTIQWVVPRLEAANEANSTLQPVLPGTRSHRPEFGEGGHERVPFRFTLESGTGPKGGGGGTAVATRTSCLITVTNQSQVTIRLLSQTHEKGDFVSFPPAEIGPGESYQFSFTETEGATEHTCQGSATYGLDATNTTTWTLQWFNTEHADNAAQSTLAGTAATTFGHLDQVGAGDENVPVVFSLTGGVAVGPGPTPVPPGPEPTHEDFQPPVEQGEPTLRIGDQSVDGWVEYLQEMLNSRGGASLTVDGDFGHGTYNAVVAFQQRRGLQVDGTVGNQTWAALRDETPQPPSSDGREPHTYVEVGDEARWSTEDAAVYYDAAEDRLCVLACNTGSTTLASGQYTATAFLTLPSGQQDIELLTLAPEGAGVAPGEFVYFVLRDVKATIGPGRYHVEAYLPQELGGDATSGDFDTEVP